MPKGAKYYLPELAKFPVFFSNRHVQLPGFRRINRESSRLGQTSRRLVEEASMVSPGRHEAIRSVSPASQVKQPPSLLVESRMARRKVMIAATISLVLAWILFRLVAG
ncbi:MAG: hypothetical protein EBS97_03330 [Verrucomicrobia bacterium]|nr:hypothetical protein [Verrucomicrobiota bacterium]